MIRVHVICEGQTEENFVNELLQETFLPRQIQLLPSMVGKPGHKGGNFKYERLLRDIETRLLRDRECCCTTFFDFYALPQSFPGRQEAGGLRSVAAKSECLCRRLVERLTLDIGENTMRRFIPYVQMYDFEGLLFSDPAGIATGIGKPHLAEDFWEIRRQFSTPEEINDSVATAPGKRLESLVSEYEKPTYGMLAALDVGLAAMRRECPIFRGWLEKLEALTPEEES